MAKQDFIDYYTSHAPSYERSLTKIRSANRHPVKSFRLLYRSHVRPVPISCSFRIECHRCAQALANEVRIGSHTEGPSGSREWRRPKRGESKGLSQTDGQSSCSCQLLTSAVIVEVSWKDRMFKFSSWLSWLIWRLFCWSQSQVWRIWVDTKEESASIRFQARGRWSTVSSVFANLYVSVSRFYIIIIWLYDVSNSVLVTSISICIFLNFDICTLCIFFWRDFVLLISSLIVLHSKNTFIFNLLSYYAFIMYI